MTNRNMRSPMTHEDQSEKYTVKHGSTACKPNLKGDWLNFFLLLLLYTMQGVPLGLANIVPLILQSKKNVSYQNQALYSIVKYPFVLKLLWAPLVDTIYIQKLGKRKSWLIPIQCLIGACFLYLSVNINDLIPETGKPDIIKIVFVFFICTLMTATQDIVIDGWALTMLKKNNVGYASTCNTTGLAIGLTISSVFSVLFTSENFCNTYLRITPDTGGIMTMKSLFFIWGVLYIVVTILIVIFKKENDNTLEYVNTKSNIVQNYLLIWNILKLSNIQTLAIALFTVKIGFAATDHVLQLKLVDANLSIENLISIKTGINVVKIFIPLVIAKFTTGPKPINIYLNVTLFKLFWNIPLVILIDYTPILLKSVNVPIYYYVLIICILLIQEILSYITYTASLAFFTRISDPRYGGTYMTLLNTLGNLGSTWPSSIALGMVDVLTLKECSTKSTNNCSTQDLQHTCNTNNSDCVTMVNGHDIEVAICIVFGTIWYVFFKNILKNLQTTCDSPWLVNNVKQTENT